jgi:magnesium-transporting ATPase (P-type)
MRIVQIFVVFSLAFVVGVLLVLGIAYEGFKDDVQNTILAALSILIASIPVALPLVLVSSIHAFVFCLSFSVRPDFLAFRPRFSVSPFGV